MPQPRGLTRADLPDELTRETIRRIPVPVLKRLARPGNGVLDAEEQATFDALLHEVMSETAGRVSRRLDRADWANVRRDAARRGGPGAGTTGRPSRVDQQLRRLAQQIDEHVDLAESLAPGVDWSFAQDADAAPAPDATDPEPDTTDTTDTSDHEPDSTDTVSDLEDRLTEQVELVQVMSEIAEVSKRTFDLEQQRDLQNTRSVFFGFVVSVAVLVAGWAPIVAADDWAERWWILGLTVATVVVAGLVYALVRRWQHDHDPDEDASA